VRVLILGGDGMLGHQLLKSWSGRHDVTVTVHGPLGAYADSGLFTAANTRDNIDATNLSAIGEIIRDVAPQAVINCIGIVKQRPLAKTAVSSILINSLLPHQLLELCAEHRARLVLMSTDCVFSGRRGAYRETDTPDPVDLYGRSKLLGEVLDAPGLTLRTSIIGLELRRFTSLVEWFLAQRGRIHGYRRAIYSGFTTEEMARIIERVLLDHPDLSGVWQVASAPINKFDLLVKLAGILGRQDVEIEPDDEFVCDRSLLADAFETRTGYQPPSWDTMLEELAGAIKARDARKVK
jgi:dTDP-4-dehydrorhamnose reductase